MKYSFVPSSRHYCAGDQPDDLMIRSRDNKTPQNIPQDNIHQWYYLKILTVCT